jgi:ATP-dependent Zn protease
VKFNDDVKNHNLQLVSVADANDYKENTFYDQGVIYDKARNRTVNSAQVKLNNVCYVGWRVKRTVQILAWILLAFYAFCFLVILIFYFIFCWRGNNLGGIWKFLLHMWWKL